MASQARLWGGGGVCEGGQTMANQAHTWGGGVFREVKRWPVRSVPWGVSGRSSNGQSGPYPGGGVSRRSNDSQSGRYPGRGVSNDDLTGPYPGGGCQGVETMTSPARTLGGGVSGGQTMASLSHTFGGGGVGRSNDDQ